MGENDPSAAGAAQPGKHTWNAVLWELRAILALRVGAGSAAGAGSVSAPGDLSLLVFWGKEEIHITHHCYALVKKPHWLHLGGRGKV